MASILILNNAADAHAFAASLASATSHQVSTAPTAREALLSLCKAPADLVIIDVPSADTQAAILLKALRATPSLQHARIMLLIAGADREVLRHFAAYGVSDIVLKLDQFQASLPERIEKALAPHPSHHAPQHAAPTHAEHAAPADAPTPRAAPAPRIAHHVQRTRAPALPLRPLREQAILALRAIPPVATSPDINAELLEADIAMPGIRHCVQRTLNLAGLHETSLQELAHAVRFDPGMCVRLLQRANSNEMDRGSPVETTARASQRLGVEGLRSVAMDANALTTLEETTEIAGLRTDWLWEHSAAVGLLAERLGELAKLRIDEGVMFTVGLLHDLGRLALAHTWPERYARVLHEAAALGLPLDVVESRLLRIDHAQAGERLMRQWELSPRMLGLVGLHHAAKHDLNSLSPGQRDPLMVLTLADRLAHGALLGGTGLDMLNTTDEFMTHFALEPHLLDECVTAVERELDAARLETFGAAHQSTLAESLRNAAGARVRTETVSLHPESDTIARFTRRLWPTDPDALPDVLCVRVSDPARREAVRTLLQRRERELERTTIPLLIAGDSKACLYRADSFGDRPLRQVVLPISGRSLIAEIQDLAASADCLAKAA